MIKHYTKAKLIEEINNIIVNGPYVCISNGHGKAGNLLENLLGITGGNLDVADAVGFELKTSFSPNTPITLFHKDPKPRVNKKLSEVGAIVNLIQKFGWDSQYGPEGHIVKSFRATIYGEWKNSQTGEKLFINADNDRVILRSDYLEIAYWDSNDLVAAAASKLRNMMFVDAKVEKDGKINFIKASLYEQFQPFKFIKAIESGHIAIDFDARTNPNSNTVRNHGTKFRIKEKNMPMIYNKVTPIQTLLE